MKPTYSKRAAKAINRINNPFKQNIKEAIENLPSGDIKKLQGYKNAYRLRIGDYRILFDMNGKIEITDVLPRGAAYKN
ncbi:MAG: type II toxin-antitoxin system RelE/ParE family toxin [Defluviitaleaceae bacterium]|nr:type II toxin-antitoxin system RelE/ParE family toxin [Defluviitaleaceae bacterium]